ncbi:hypothetical protein ACHAWO_004600 [Cyclotella atomus]|uniref:Uncharacterized protein n=1 Tax=Cyclotella atomus TaxID=382360 RepID=A0ABD3PLZ3_9STRA
MKPSASSAAMRSLGISCRLNFWLITQTPKPPGWVIDPTQNQFRRVWQGETMSKGRIHHQLSIYDAIPSISPSLDQCMEYRNHHIYPCTL